MNYLPIVITAYNRAEHLAATLEALSQDRLADESNLYLFVDGPKNDGDALVRQTVEMAKMAKGFKHVEVMVRDRNIGLANNVITSVSEVMKQNPGAIVLEDDMIVSSHFLTFMNQAFEVYKDNPFVGCITGYCPPISELSSISEDLFMSTRSSTWGWAMKSEDWFDVDWSEDVLKKTLDSELFSSRLDLAGNDRRRILEHYLTGKLDVWGIRRASWQIINEKLTVYPRKSLLKNIGLDGSGQNCVKIESEPLNVDFEFIPKNYPQPTAYQPNNLTETLFRRFYSK